MSVKRKILVSAALITLAGTGWAGSVMAKQLPAMSDRSAVTLTGSVRDVRADEFTLDYGANQITVEMDEGWSWFRDPARVLRPGERVTISGIIDDDLFEGREIEANTVYVHDRYTYFYGDDQVSDDRIGMGMDYDGPSGDGAYITASGTVREISGREFMLDTGAATIQVDTLPMAYNPMDDDGLQKIMPGDRVHVTGILDDGLFERKEIQANTIVSLQQNVLAPRRMN